MNEDDSCVTFIEPIVMKDAKKLLCNYTLVANINQCSYERCKETIM